MKNRLLGDFVGEQVLIITTQTMTAETESGPAEVPICADGFLVDYDEHFVLLETAETHVPALVAISHIVKLDKYVEPVEPMPDRDGMN